MAEELRSALADATSIAARLVAALRTSRKEKKLLTRVLSNLKQLEATGRRHEMSAIVIQRCHRLAESLAELKLKLRAALATELAAAVATAVRDVLVVALIDRLVVPPRPNSIRPPATRRTAWSDEGDDRERDEWGYPKDPWDEPEDSERYQTSSRYTRDEPKEESMPTIPTAAAVAVGVNVGRWWLAKKGTVTAAVGIGVLATGLGLAGGPVARAALAVLAAASDVLTAESALARIDPS